ncbi:MAG TPA: hypothetical protein PK280_15875 [Planctomycetota bacterium]|nr:hypothetical protein [Planctomycetota bacterium]
MRRQLWLALAAFLVCGSLAFGGDDGGKKPEEGKRDGAKKENPLPEGARGFVGQLKGAVEKKLDRGILLKVAEVVKTAEASKATDAKVLVGLSVRVGPSWVKGEEGKKGHPDELQMNFLRSLEAGKEVTLSVKNVEREYFALAELTPEQTEAAKSYKKPEGDKGEKKPEGEGDKKPEQPKTGGEF